MKSRVEEIQEELKKLGIVAEIKRSNVSDWDEQPYPKADIFIIFRSEHDRNLYRVAGSLKESWWLAFDVADDVRRRYE